MKKNVEDMSAIQLFFFYLNADRRKLIDIIDSCSSKIGVAIDTCVVCAFAEEYEEYEEGYFGNSGLKIVLLEPLMDEEKEVVYSIEEFWGYIIQYYEENLMYYSEKEKWIIERKLENFKRQN